MADEKTVQQKGEKKSFWQKLGNFFKNLPANIARPFVNMWHELRKVTWPTRKDLVNYTLIVIVFMVFMGVVIGLLDMGSSALIKALIAL
jgi:preprotein translocase subunit SecE